jgi:hypothetical protein
VIYCDKALFFKNVEASDRLVDASAKTLRFECNCLRYGTNRLFFSFNMVLEFVQNSRIYESLNIRII